MKKIIVFLFCIMLLPVYSQDTYRIKRAYYAVNQTLYMCCSFYSYVRQMSPEFVKQDGIRQIYPKEYLQSCADPAPVVVTSATNDLQGGGIMVAVFVEGIARTWCFSNDYLGLYDYDGDAIGTTENLKKNLEELIVRQKRELGL